MISLKVNKTILEIHFSNGYPFLLVLALLLYSSLVFSQEKNTMENLAKQLEQQAINKSNLSVYLQTSKDIYETGEDLWFKGYLLNAQDLYPSILDKILYVQLEREDNNQVVLNEKYQIENGFVDGNIRIADSLSPGNYKLSAYSSQSFNNNSKEFYAFRKLKIVDQISDQLKDKTPLKKDKAIKNESMHFSLFPEGGHLVSGLQSTVGFKAVDSKGFPKDISGIVYENDKELLSFKSTHAGMGSFLLTPNINKTYHVKLVDSLAQTSFEFPKIETHGMGVQLLSNSKKELKFRVSQSPNSKKEILYLRVQIRGVVYRIAKAILDKDIIIKIPIKDLPQGIAEITLFDENLTPLAERLVYINIDQKLYIKTTLDKSDYFTKEQAQLKIKVTDQNEKPIVAHLSLSIYDQIFKNPKDSKTIESHYQLSTQLKGNLYNPSYYFDKKNEDRKQALNLLLLTQGWRNYAWNQQNLKTLKPLINLYIKDQIEGQFTYIKKRKNTTKQNVLAIFNPRDDRQQKFILLDSLGAFTLEAEDLKIGTELYIKHFDDKNKVKVIIKNPFDKINKIKETKNYMYPLTLLLEKEKQSNPNYNWRYRQGEVALDEVVIKAKKNRVVRDKYLSKLDSLAKLEMTTDYVCTIDNFLNCVIHHESVSTSKRPVEGGKYQKLIVLKNGSWFDATEFPTTVYNNPYMAPYRYPELTDANLMNMFNLKKTKGLYPKKIFYEPVYDTYEQLNGFPDYRNTLYWKSDIITDKNGEAEISFYCSDINTHFKGVIEGVSGTGLLGTHSFQFYVAKKRD